MKIAKTDASSQSPDPGFPGDQSLFSNPEAAISVQNLTKTYKLYPSPKDRFKESFHPLRKKFHDDFYALCNVNFEIKKGETVGILGRNGSGKSTLLKLVTGIMTPSSGSIAVNGRVSALLELGAGFNPEMSGIENIYFNGTLMGYSREEMDAKMDDVLSFADIGPFINQPVKTYSSGMFVRVAFALAISVDPEILIIDEALSVGDEAFQRKCFSRIQTIKEKGGTILFVSHSTSTIVELCNRAILLDKGELLLSGTPKLVVSRYQRLISAPVNKVGRIKEEIRASADAMNQPTAGEEAAPLSNVPVTEGLVNEKSSEFAYYDQFLCPQSTVVYESRGAIISDPMILSLNGDRVNVLLHGEEYVYTYTVTFTEEASNVRFGTLIKTLKGVELGGMVSHSSASAIGYVAQGTKLQPHFGFRCSLLPGVYFMNAGVVGSIDGTELPLHRIIDACMFKVQPQPNMLVHGIINFSIGPKPAHVARIA